MEKCDLVEHRFSGAVQSSVEHRFICAVTLKYESASAAEVKVSQPLKREFNFDELKMHA